MSHSERSLAHNENHADQYHERWIERLNRHSDDPANNNEASWKQCGGCRYYVRLTGAFILDWGACTNPSSSFDGRVMFEHDGCQEYSPASDGWGSGYPVRREQSWQWFCKRITSSLVSAHEAVLQGELARARGLIRFAANLAHRMMLRMEPEGELGSIPPSPLPEVPLERFNTPANRRLAEELQHALEAALVVDRERGWFPHGLARTIGDLAATVQEELQVEQDSHPA